MRKTREVLRLYFELKLGQRQIAQRQHQSEHGARLPGAVSSDGSELAIAGGEKHLTAAPLIRHLSEAGNARQGFFSDLEFRNVASNLEPDLADFALFGYLTGWRKGEINSLRWSDVDGDVVRLQAENSKNGEARFVTLEGELAELIERRKACRQVKTKTAVVLSDLVFHRDGEPIRDFRKAWTAAFKMAGVPLRLFHDLRRTAVRNMIRAGVPDRVAMQVSGHKTRSMLDRYNIVSEKDQREAMQKTQAYLASAAEEERKRLPVQIRRPQ